MQPNLKITLSKWQNRQNDRWIFVYFCFIIQGHIVFKCANNFKFSVRFLWFPGSDIVGPFVTKTTKSSISFNLADWFFEQKFPHFQERKSFFFQSLLIAMDFYLHWGKIMLKETAWTALNNFYKMQFFKSWYVVTVI